MRSVTSDAGAAGIYCKLFTVAQKSFFSVIEFHDFTAN